MQKVRHLHLRRPPCLSAPTPTSSFARPPSSPGGARSRPESMACIASSAVLNQHAISEMKKVSCDEEVFELTALSPLDGRYAQKVEELSPILSEYGLIRYRVLVEVKWLQKLSLIPEVIEVPEFSEDAKLFLDDIFNNFNLDDAKEVKRIEKVTNHDVKAVEYFLKQRCQAHHEVAKTASPTTLGKEMSIFVSRLRKQQKLVSQVQIMGKFAGAVGNYNAHLVSYPEIDWPEIAETFVRSLGVHFNSHVTQIEPHDYMAELFDAIVRFNNALLDFNRDIWGYLSLGYFKQTTKAGEIGSSTMPHKVNPIDFENSEGNLGLASSVLGHLSAKLPISKWQCDLTDSTVLRNMGPGLGYCLLAWKSTLIGIGKLQVNEARVMEDLDHSWELLAEAIQTVMRRYGIPEPCEKLKELTRGKAITKEGLKSFIQNLVLPEDAKATLLELSPDTYIGAARQLAEKKFR